MGMRLSQPGTARVPTDRIVRSIAIKSALFILYYALNELGTYKNFIMT